MRATLSHARPGARGRGARQYSERYLLGDGRTTSMRSAASIWLLEYQTQDGRRSGFERALAIAYRVRLVSRDPLAPRAVVQAARGFREPGALLERKRLRAWKTTDTRVRPILIEVADIRLAQTWGKPRRPPHCCGAHWAFARMTSSSQACSACQRIRGDTAGPVRVDSSARGRRSRRKARAGRVAAAASRSGRRLRACTMTPWPSSIRPTALGGGALTQSAGKASSWLASALRTGQ